MSTTKTFAIVFVILLVSQAFAVNKPSAANQRKGKNIQLSAMNSDKNKGYALPANKQLYVVKKGRDHKKKKLQSCLCDNESTFKSTIYNITHRSGSLERFKRSFETIGTCLTSVNRIRITQRSIDYVCTEPFNFETLTSFCTQMKELAQTTEKRHFKVSHSTCVQRLTTCTATIQVIVPVSVTVEAMTSISTYVDTLTQTKACVQTLRSVSKMARTLTTEKVCARRLTTASASICALKTVHECIKQKAARTVKCKSNRTVSGSRVKDFPSSSDSSKDKFVVSGGDNGFLSNNSNNNDNNSGNNNSYNNNNSNGSDSNGSLRNE